MLGENDSSPVVWDYVAVYSKGALWDQIPPKPIYFHVPVISATERLNDAIRPLLLAAAKTQFNPFARSSTDIGRRFGKESSGGHCGYEAQLTQRNSTCAQLFLSAPDYLHEELSVVTLVLRRERYAERHPELS